MPKILSRIVALFLLPCLFLNSALAQELPALDFTATQSAPNFSFLVQAITPAGTLFTKPSLTHVAVNVAQIGGQLFSLSDLLVLDTRNRRMIPLRYLRLNELTREELLNAIRAFIEWPPDSQYARVREGLILILEVMAGLRSPDQLGSWADVVHHVRLAWTKGNMQGYLMVSPERRMLTIMQSIPANRKIWRRKEQIPIYQGVGTELLAAAMRELLWLNPTKPIKLSGVRKTTAGILKKLIPGFVMRSTSFSLSAEWTQAFVEAQAVVRRQMEERYPSGGSVGSARRREAA